MSCSSHSACQRPLFPPTVPTHLDLLPRASCRPTATVFGNGPWAHTSNANVLVGEFVVTAHPALNQRACLLLSAQPFLFTSPTHPPRTHLIFVGTLIARTLSCWLHVTAYCSNARAQRAPATCSIFPCFFIANSKTDLGHEATTNGVCTGSARAAPLLRSSFARGRAVCA